MKRKISAAVDWLEGLLDPEENPDEPFFDPVHLAAVLIVWLVSIGCLYWLLWTLLVYEGGLLVKARAIASVAFSGKTLKDYGYEASPYAMGVFEGWVGNVAALILTSVVIGALYRLYQEAARRSAGRRHG